MNLGQGGETRGLVPPPDLRETTEIVPTRVCAEGASCMPI